MVRRTVAVISLCSVACGAWGAIVLACGSDDGTPAEDSDARMTETANPEASTRTDAAPDAGDAGTLCIPPAGDASVVDFAVPAADGGTGPLRIARGADGDVWITDSLAPRLLRATASGTMTVVPITAPASGITLGPDGAIWFTAPSVGKIGRIAPNGAITEFSLPTVDGGPATPLEITTGPDGNLWITEYDDSVVRLTTAGVATKFDVGAGLDASTPLLPGVITTGPDGNLWFAAVGVPVITRITTSGTVTHFEVSDRSFGVATGPDHALWFTMHQKLGRITFEPNPRITELDEPDMQPAEIVAGPDCTTLYVADFLGNRVRRFVPPVSDAGPSFVDFAVPTATADVESLSLGPSGSVWFVEVAAQRVGFVQP